MIAQKARFPMVFDQLLLTDQADKYHFGAELWGQAERARFQAGLLPRLACAGRSSTPPSAHPTRYASLRAATLGLAPHAPGSAAGPRLRDG